MREGCECFCAIDLLYQSVIHQARTLVQNNSLDLGKDTKTVKQERQSMHAAKETMRHL